MKKPIRLGEGGPIFEGEKFCAWAFQGILSKFAFSIKRGNIAVKAVLHTFSIKYIPFTYPISGKGMYTYPGM